MNRFVRWSAQGWFLLGFFFYLGFFLSHLFQGKAFGVLLTLEVFAASALGVAVFHFLGTALLPALSHWNFSAVGRSLPRPLVDYRERPSRTASLLFTVLPAIALAVGISGLIMDVKDAADYYPVGLVAFPFFGLFVLHGKTTRITADDDGFVVQSLLGSTGARWSDVASVDKVTVERVPTNASRIVHQTSGQLPRSTKSLVIQGKDGRTVARLSLVTLPGDGLNQFLALCRSKTSLPVGSSTKSSSEFLDL